MLFFFAVTGLTLNHPQWGAGQQKTVQYKGRLDPRWLPKGDPQNIDRLKIVEYLRNAHKITGEFREFHVEDEQCSISFRGPGYRADVVVDLSNGVYDGTETTMGLAGVFNDLHKGRNSGKTWSLIIDISAVSMAFVSVSGLVLLCFLQRRRFTGLLAAAAGAVLCYIIYLNRVL